MNRHRGAVWYQRRVTELWTDLSLLSRDAVALHLLLSDLAFLRGPLPEDEEELRRVVGVSDSLWTSWPEIAHLWPTERLRGGNIGFRTVRVNPPLGEAFSEASEACAVNRKRAKKAANTRWNAVRDGDARSNAPSNASSVLGAMQIEREKERKKERERPRISSLADIAPKEAG